MRPVGSLSISLIATALFAVEGAIGAVPGEGGSEINDTVLGLLQSMPVGGGYSISRGATAALGSAIAHVPGALVVRPAVATPSYCSGATYIVFLRLFDRLGRSGFPIDDETRSALLVRGQRDGEGVWGRWNANGPGTARLFHELDVGSNFTDYSLARPGDFMKIFWTSEVGRAERGHSVIYIGREMVGGTEHVRFWSSNKPAGYGEKTVPRSKIARAIFSRLDRPQNLARVRALPRHDPYLASLLTVRSSFGEACAKSGCK